MCCVGAGVLLFLIGYVVPMVTKIFDRMNQQLPLPTQLLMAITDFVNSYLFIFVIFAVIAIFAVHAVGQEEPEGQAVLGQLRPALPHVRRPLSDGPGRQVREDPRHPAQERRPYAPVPRRRQLDDEEHHRGGSGIKHVQDGRTRRRTSRLRFGRRPFSRRI